MYKDRSSKKYNALLFALSFIVPIMALNCSFYLLSRINKSWAEKEHYQTGVQQAEILASEADFSSQLSMLFRRFIEVVKNDASINVINDYFLNSHLEQNANSIFRSPFPDYDLYVFKKKSPTDSPELILAKGNIVGGRRSLCRAFEHLYKLNTDLTITKEKAKATEAFARSLIGPYVSVETVARELRGTATFAKAKDKSSWFIWDYIKTHNNCIYGIILNCGEINNYEYYGRCLAIRDLSLRGKAIGAFLPIYKDYGAPVIPSILKKSAIFIEWASNLIIKDGKELYKWIKESLPQGIKLGNYTAYTALARQSSHIAVVLLKSIDNIKWPKWLLVTNWLFSSALVFVLFVGLVFDKWPPLNLKVRFALCYSLAAALPLSLLVVAGYGYVLQYKRTLINQTATEIQSAMKQFDGQKMSVINEYKAAFAEALNDKQLISIIKSKGVTHEDVAKRVVDIFEKRGNPLPLLGARIWDEVGKGSFRKGTAPTQTNMDLYFKSFTSVNVNLLRTKLREEFADADFWMKQYEPGEHENLAEDAYKALTNNYLSSDLRKHYSIPLPRKNGDLNTIQIYDYIKIDGKCRYILFVVWDDQTLDNRVLQQALDTYALKNLRPTFAGYRLDGQNVSLISKKTRHTNKYISEKAETLARVVGARGSGNNYIDDKYLIYAIPSRNFISAVFVGWLSLDDITNDIYVREAILGVLLLISVFILFLCGRRSVNVFLMPITSIKEALDEVSMGNLAVELSSANSDELGQLSTEFSDMISGLRERERLSKLISDKAVEALQNRSGTMLDFTETFKGVALVSDIRNFTGISETYDPMLITDLLNEHFAEMTKIISNNGGLIYKYIGDAIEAVFPEDRDLEASAYERAFKAGCQMISRLTFINLNRRKRKLFTYKAGVGLCSGTMYSGSVGSVETRLDYAILGEPLKIAAKLESLSSNNPLFPIVVDEPIAEAMAANGVGFKALGCDGVGKAYIFNEILNNDSIRDIDIGKFADSNENKNETTDETDFPNKIINVQNTDIWRDKWRDFSMGAVFIMSVCICLILGFNALYYTTMEKLKSESDIESSRVLDQICVDDNQAAAFENTCLDFSYDCQQILEKQDFNVPLADLLRPVQEKYEALKRPVPYFSICRQRKGSFNKKDLMAYGFNKTVMPYIASVTYYYSQGNDDFWADRINEALGKICDNSMTRFFVNTLHYRRSAVSKIGKEETYMYTDKLFDSSNGNFMAFAWYSMPKNIEPELLLPYYMALGRDTHLVAANCGDKWYFSDNFPKDEEMYLRTADDSSGYVKEKGYQVNTFELGDKKWTAYAVSKELINSYKPMKRYNIFASIVSVLLLLMYGIYIWKTDFSRLSLSSKLFFDICIASFIPVLTVFLVLYLYLQEDYQVKKTEAKYDLQRLIDEVESRDCYLHPLCWQRMNDLANSSELKELVNAVNNSKDSKTKEDNIGKIQKFLLDNTDENKSFPVHTLCLFNEIILVDKNGWSASISDTYNAGAQKNALNFGSLLTDLCKLIFLKQKGVQSETEKAKAVKGEMIVDNLAMIYSSSFGSNAGFRLINLPGKPLTVNITYVIIGEIVLPVPSQVDADYVLMALALFRQWTLAEFCIMRNDVYPMKTHVKDGCISDKKYIFYSENSEIGNRLCSDKIPEVSRELLSTAQWINSSNIPLSKTIDLNGKHLIEARQGNNYRDNVFIAFSSEAPIKASVMKNIPTFAAVLLLTVLMIIYMARTVCNDMLAPIMKLMEGVKAAQSEKYSYRTNSDRTDEIGEVCNAFDKMMKGLEEKQLMNRMVSKTARDVSADASDKQSKKIDSVLVYVSVPNFSGIMRDMPPYMLYSKLRQQIATICEIVMKNGGDVDKIMGEKLLIAFHVGDKPVVDVAKSACKSALEIATAKNMPFAVAVGINRGDVISGFLGVGAKQDFTIIGDSVNVTARIASLSEETDDFPCLISESVFDIIGNDLKAEKFGEVALKGKALPMSVYRLQA